MTMTRVAGADHAGDRDAARCGQQQVDEDDVRTEPPRQPHGLGAAVGLCNHLEVGRAREQGPHAVADDRLLVRDQHPARPSPLHGPATGHPDQGGRS
jgi:hypothetical protein